MPSLPRPLRIGLVLLSLLWIALAPPAGSAAPAQAEAKSATTAPYRLAALLDPALTDRSLGQTPRAVQVLDLSTGEEVYAYHGDMALMPASTMKVITSAVALRTLGPAYRFRTRILVDERPGGDGVLPGNLYIQGGGDPTLVIEKLWKMVFDLRLEGVQEIKGNVIFDDTHFDADAGIPGWDKDEDVKDGPSYFPSLGALGLNFNTVAVVVAPGAKVGGPARMELETPSVGVSVVNQAITGGRGSRRWLKLEREIRGSQTIFTLSGTIPADSDARRYYRAVADPTGNFIGAFEVLCKQNGIRIAGKTVRGPVPDSAKEFLVLESPPLAAILMDMNKFSNNFMAEQVLKAVGAEVHGLPGTTAKGLQVVDAYLQALGIPAADYKVVNGSGLSRQTMLRPAHLTAVLQDLYQDGQVGGEFWASLAIGGVDGTLRRRFSDPDEVGRMRGKTGSLNGVFCLVGYVQGLDKHVYAFAYLVNGITGPASDVRLAHDRFVEALLSLQESRDSLAGGQ